MPSRLGNEIVSLWDEYEQAATPEAKLAKALDKLETILQHNQGKNLEDGGSMDNDLDSMPREQLVAEVKKLRQGIREHRDSTGHGLCWHHPALWSLLPDQSDPLPVVPEWPQFLRGCIRYRQSLDEQAPDAPRSDKPFR